MNASILIYFLTWAYSSVVERVHGMDEVGVRFSLGPPNMKITKFIHSCILLEEGSQKLLFDVGPFSFIDGKVKPEQFQGINAILITHKHGDHVDPNAVKTIQQNNPGLRIITNQDTADVLKESGIEAEILETGESKIGDLAIKAFPATHGPMPVSPLPTNTAYIVNDKFIHPGDSLDHVIFEHKVEVIALPVAASWLKMVESVDFADSYAPKKVVPVHDGFIKEFYSSTAYAMWDKLLDAKGIGFEKMLNPGDSVEI